MEHVQGIVFIHGRGVPGTYWSVIQIPQLRGWAMCTAVQAHLRVDTLACVTVHAQPFIE